MQGNTVERAEVGQLETNCGECMDSDIGVGDPEIVDMQVVALLTSLAEQQGSALGRTMTEALLHAAHRLCEFWDDDEEDEPFAGGPNCVDASEPSAPTSSPPHGETPDTLGMFR